MAPPIVPGAPATNLIVVVSFWIVLYGWILSEIWLGWRRRPGASAATQDRGSQWIVIIGVWSSVLLGISLASATRMLVVTTGRSVFVLVGIGLIIAGMALRWYAIHLLGQSFTVEVATRPGQAVVERGPYRLIRHPSYAGTLVTIIGVLVACANPVAVLGLIPALIAYSYRVRVEERALTEGLGEAYRAYMRRTRRLIPFLY